jgi:hypothetical protein
VSRSRGVGALRFCVRKCSECGNSQEQARVLLAFVFYKYVFCVFCVRGAEGTLLAVYSLY